jgi:arylsulfatase
MVAVTLPGFAGAAPSAPNVVLIFVDDLGYADLGCYGAKQIRTPHIDQLAAEGTRFTSFYVAQAVCTASRAALLTGVYPNRIGMGGALNHTSPTGIHPTEKLLSNLFKEQGYATAIFGKWHLGHHRPFLPTRRGFDEWLGIPYSNDLGPLHPVTPGLPSLPLYEGEEIIEADPDQAQFTQRFTARAIDFIERHRTEPFFLYVPHVMPHVPIFASERFRGRSAAGLYGDVVEELDDSVGNIMATLRRLHLDERTLVIFASDNGPWISYGEHAGSAGPFREGKLTAFEGGHRTPCIVRWPGRVPAGRVSDELVAAMDLHATLARVIGAMLPEKNYDGRDLRPLLFGESGAKGRDEFWYYSTDELHAVRRGDWKLHLPHEYLTLAAAPGHGGKPANYGQIRPGAAGSIENSGLRGIAARHGYRFEKIGGVLYNLRDDPGETHDVAAAHPDIVAQLQLVAAAARADLGDALTHVKAAHARPVGDARPTLPAGVTCMSNIEYTRTPAGMLALDLYLPEQKESHPLPILVWVHGGGWKSGSKLNCPLLWLAAKGFAVASLDVRLLPVASWPAQLEDPRAAVRWLRENAARYQLDPQRIAIAGGSSGGHVAALVGTSPAPEGETVSSRVQAVMDLYGPADLLTMPANLPGSGRTDADLATANGARLLGGIVRDRPELARQASALYQVTNDDPPFLILHGDQDPQVPLEQSQRLHARLQEAGVSSELHIIAGAGHGGKAFDTPAVRQTIRAFLERVLLAR